MKLHTFFLQLFKSNNFRDVEKIIVGLGNPGEKYEGTRHNVGFEVIDRLSETLFERKEFSQCKSQVLLGSIDSGKKIALIKPQTFMNLSGEAVAAVLQNSGLASDQILVLVDDLNISLGKIRFRNNGSHGGHNGLKSIIAHVGSNFPRLRIGIGPIPPSLGVIDFVLGTFEEHQQSAVRTVVTTSVEAIQYYIGHDMVSTMNKYN